MKLFVGGSSFHIAHKTHGYCLAVLSAEAEKNLSALKWRLSATESIAVRVVDWAQFTPDSPTGAYKTESVQVGELQVKANEMVRCSLGLQALFDGMFQDIGKS